MQNLKLKNFKREINKDNKMQINECFFSGAKGEPGSAVSFFYSDIIFNPLKFISFLTIAYFFYKGSKRLSRLACKSYNIFISTKSHPESLSTLPYPIIVLFKPILLVFCKILESSVKASSW